MKTLLFPTDFSKAAENALTYALKLADQLDASLHLLHAYHYTLADTSYMPGELLHALEVEQEEEALREIVKYEQKIQEKVGKQIPVTHKLTYGFAQERIVEYAREIQADLIVMGTTGAGTVLGQWVGSVASGVMARAHCPVLAIPEEATFDEIHQFTYACSFEEDEPEIFTKLLGFASRMGAELSCVHIRTEPEEAEDPNAKAGDQFFRSQVEASGLEYFLLEYPDISEGLDQFLTINKTDILMMMTHKRSILDKLLKPSLSRKMVLQTEVPLLVFQKENVHHLVENTPSAS